MAELQSIVDEGGASLKINAAGITPDGFPLNGPADLRKYLASHPDQFVTTVTEKLMTYALGRGVKYYDMPLVRQVTHDAETKGNRFSAMFSPAMILTRETSASWITLGGVSMG